MPSKVGCGAGSRQAAKPRAAGGRIGRRGRRPGGCNLPYFRIAAAATRVGNKRFLLLHTSVGCHSGVFGNGGFSLYLPITRAVIQSGIHRVARIISIVCHGKL